MRHRELQNEQNREFRERVAEAMAEEEEGEASDEQRKMVDKWLQQKERRRERYREFSDRLDEAIEAQAKGVATDEQREMVDTWLQKLERDRERHAVTMRGRYAQVTSQSPGNSVAEEEVSTVADPTPSITG